jgi:hypothetical protein
MHDALAALHPRSWDSVSGTIPHFFLFTPAQSSRAAVSRTVIRISQTAKITLTARSGIICSEENSIGIDTQEMERIPSDRQNWA